MKTVTRLNEPAFRHITAFYIALVFVSLFSAGCKNPWDSTREADAMTQVALYLDKHPKNTPENPIPLTVYLASYLDWEDLLSLLDYKGRYVNLDISRSTGMTQFDPGKLREGKYLIVSLVLPLASTGIVDGTEENGPFKYFTNLEEISGAKIETLGSYSLHGLFRLTKAEFPALTAINNHAFSGCRSLTSINIPDGITAIGRYAFHLCDGLTNITIGNGVTVIEESAFSNCTRLTDITIPDSVTVIGGSAFSGCTNLTTVTIPNGVTAIGRGAFSGCSSLTAVTIPNGITVIEDSTFIDCTGLTDITIPNNITAIKKWAFYDCTGLTDITIGNSVTVIGNSAFYGCSSLTDITIGNSVTTIGGGAFYGCSGLTDITIPDSVTTIGDGAFSDCTSLTDIHVDSGNANYSSEQGVLYNKDKTTLITYPAGAERTITSFIIPNSVTAVGNSAFAGCTNLTTITIPNSVTSIGEYAFLRCTSLTTVTFTETMDKFGFFLSSFMGDLFFKYYFGEGPGTYTTPAAGWEAVWSRQV